MKLDEGYVLLPQPIEGEALQLLREKGLEVVQAKDPKPETVAPLMSGARAIILRTGITITRDLLERSEDLWTISRTGAGVDNVDLNAAAEKGILVTSSLGVNTTSVVEHCFALILALSKQLFFMDREVRKGNFQVRYKNLSRDLREKYLGVVGFGRIGSELARYCHTIFNMNILAYDPYIPEELKKEVSPYITFTSLEDVFQNSDVISIHIPLNQETKGIVSWKYLRSMKRDAFLINTSRGGVLQEKDLVRALNEGCIAGAGLDVFEKEPLANDNPLLKMENVLLTPHSAALTRECVLRMATSAVMRVLDLLHGYIPENIANPEVLSLGKWAHLKKKA